MLSIIWRNNKASDIKLVSLYSTSKMMHGPINIRTWINFFAIIIVCDTNSFGSCSFTVKKNTEISHRGCNFQTCMLQPLQLTLVKTGLRLDVTITRDFFPIPAFVTIGNVRTGLITEHAANYTRPWTLSTGLLLSCEISKLSSDSLGKTLLLWEIIHSISSSFTIHVIPHTHTQHQKL